MTTEKRRKAAKKLQPFKIFFERGREGGYCPAHFNPSKGLKTGVGWGAYEEDTA